MRKSIFANIILLKTGDGLKGVTQGGQKEMERQKESERDHGEGVVFKEVRPAVIAAWSLHGGVLEASERMSQEHILVCGAKKRSRNGEEEKVWGQGIIPKA